MMFWYLVALALGGTLVVASLVLAVVGEAGDTHHDGGGEGDGDGHDHGDTDALQVWFPYASLRFWTFFLAFGGLTGALLTWAKVGGPTLVVVAIALGVGYAIGAGAAGLVRRLQQRQTDSGVTTAEIEGSTAKVMLP